MSNRFVSYFQDDGRILRAQVNMGTGRVDLYVLDGGELSQGNWTPVSRTDEPKNAPKTSAPGKR